MCFKSHAEEKCFGLAFFYACKSAQENSSLKRGVKNMTNNKNTNYNLNDFEDIKVVFERIEGDNKNIKATILWKQDKEWKESEEISVYAEIADRERHSLKLQKIEASNVWYATLIIRNNLYEIYTFDKKLAVKLVQYKIKPQKLNYSYAS